MKPSKFHPKSTIQYDSYEVIIASTAFWCTSYGILRLLLPNKPQEFTCRILTFVHGLIMAYLGVRECLMPGTPFIYPELQTTCSHKRVMVMSLGYFIFDLLWSVLFGSETKLMLTHHIYSICALARMLFKNTAGPQAMCSLGTMEITNPLLQTRWFIRSAGLYPSKLHTATEFAFFVTFVVVRIFIGTYFMFLVFTQTQNDLEFLFLAMAIYVMSWMFMINILAYVKKKYVVEEDSNKDT
ncbi:TLC domain-containing protein 5-like [Aethina tumida]|uniref:TLC domain-containing protein 5-like n=1 Tax=Aethina tumida TaxID=116153 RepID=UPI0021489BA9|nr:TLC domain-containing protein 5-like [Aethina tumida]